MVRIKYRYILVQIRCNNREDTAPVTIESNTLLKYIRENIERYYGEFGIASMLRTNVIYFNAKTHLCIIQAMHGPHRFITSILPLLTVAGPEIARYRTLYVGATLMQCNKFILKYQQRYINKTLGEYRGMGQKLKMIEDVTKMRRL
ncbi:uncharacterized protein LOC120897250 [Anopheles arabiensis]|uniref:Ribonuclease P/MRP protein subunit POP5 n=1 Tax=Anopheles arabiensis TaxID=7173 RepID=A0A182I1W2_ANOAR|nr:uncharacterized protein LOC120897250 [Anopheles arabiensis]XP_040157909.1 uncharacterized protein LOC120897250 [Anopheles arabiensis]